MGGPAAGTRKPVRLLVGVLLLVWVGRALSAHEACLWIGVSVGSDPKQIGWRIVDGTTKSTQSISGGNVLPGAYNESVVGANGGLRVFCHQVTILSSNPAATTYGEFGIELLSDDGKAWRDRNATVAVMDAYCQRIQETNGFPLQVFKDTDQSVTITLPPITLNDSCPSQTTPPPSPPGTAPASGASTLLSSSTGGLHQQQQAAQQLASTAVAALVPAGPDPFNDTLPPDWLSCPPQPKLSSGDMLGPDLIAINRRGFQTLSISRQCYNTSRPVRRTPGNPWDPAWQNYCEAIEGNVPQGCHLALRFSAGIGNVGTRDLWLGDPFTRYRQGSKFFTWSDCHEHWHWNGLANYELIDPQTNKTWRSAKAGFCAMDSTGVPTEIRMPTYRTKSGRLVRGKDWRREPMLGNRFMQCGVDNQTACQGIGTGMMDVYGPGLAGQFFCLTGCAGGNVPFDKYYIIRITANPPYSPGPGVPCPYKDRQGKCHALFELNYNNNAADFKFRLTREMISTTG